MTAPHPLDRPLWHSLTTRHAALALGGADAVRLLPEISILGAVRGHDPAAHAALLDLLPTDGQFGLLEMEPPPPIAGTRITFQAEIDQMVLESPPPPTDATLDWIDLGEEDAADMLALAALTRPGPFNLHTHRLGRFVGIRRAGMLAAMAGERMKLPGWQEVSAICTHPDWRGHGFADALMRVAIGRIVAQGDGVFLHCFPDNPAVRLYTALGFRKRRSMTYTILERA